MYTEAETAETLALLARAEENLKTWAAGLDTVEIVIGPDPYGDGNGGPAWSGSVVDNRTGDGDTIDGARGHGPRVGRCGHRGTGAWLALLRRHVKLPRAVKRAGLRWSDADVTPYGWSQGPGHAPQGIRVVWTVAS